MATDGEATEEETGDPEKFVIKIEVKWCLLIIKESLFSLLLVLI